jgi:hypothetical protein
MCFSWKVIPTLWLRIRAVTNELVRWRRTLAPRTLAHVGGEVTLEVKVPTMQRQAPDAGLPELDRQLRL